MDDAEYMKLALRLALRARGRTSPNPMVGAVAVRNGRIIGRGYHRRAGTPHAEVIAIESAPGGVDGATLYVTLEPCCHRDKRTPPCTEKIIASGIRRVVSAMADPNPKVSGTGFHHLRKAGIEVVSGVMEKEARRLNESYVKYITARRPFVTLKVAMTLDGKIATPDGESKWITGERSRRMVHRLRASADAVLTAIGTVKADDPLLTCRVPPVKNPVRIILDPRLEIDPAAKILICPPETFIVTRRHRVRAADGGKRRLLSERGVRFLEHESERADLSWLMAELGSMGITSVLVEGGSSLSASCLESGIVDKVMFFIAPKIIGGERAIPAVGGRTSRTLPQAHSIREMTARRIGEDILVEGYL